MIAPSQQYQSAFFSLACNAGSHFLELYTARPLTSMALPAASCGLSWEVSVKYGSGKVKAMMVKGVRLELVKDWTTAPARKPFQATCRMRYQLTLLAATQCMQGNLPEQAQHLALS